MQLWLWDDLHREAEARLPTKEAWRQGSRQVSFAPEGSIFRMPATDRAEYARLWGDVFNYEWLKAVEAVLRNRTDSFEWRISCPAFGYFSLTSLLQRKELSLQDLWDQGAEIPSEAASCPKMWGSGRALADNWRKSDYFAQLTKIKQARLGAVMGRNAVLLAGGAASTLEAAFPPPTRPGRPRLPRAEMNKKLPFVPDQNPTPKQVTLALAYWRQEGYQLGRKSARAVLKEYHQSEQTAKP
jgi:hypothetical protein